LIADQGLAIAARSSEKTGVMATDRGGRDPTWSLRSPGIWPIEARMPMLITGPRRATGEFVALLDPWLIEPIVHVPCGEDEVLPDSAAVGTLVLHGANQLGDSSQRELLKWLDVRVTRR
jgi:hypothetical protein